MASFEHLRGAQKPNTDEGYTCPSSNVKFPNIYKVMIPDGDLVEDQIIFAGSFTANYQLTETPNSGISDFPGFPPSPATKIRTLQADDAFYLDVVHFPNKEQAQGFRQACFHLGMELEHLSWLESDQGVFILLTRQDSQKKSGHIIYRSSKSEYIEMLGRHMECVCVSVFNSAGEIVPLKNIEDYAD